MSKQLKARVLVDRKIEDVDYKANSVIESDEGLINDLVNAGFADKNKKAVDYALKENGGQVIKHMLLADREEIQANIASLNEGLVASKEKLKGELTDEQKASVVAEIDDTEKELKVLEAQLS